MYVCNDRPSSATTLKDGCRGTQNPTWKETFIVDVVDPSNSQLEVTLWYTDNAWRWWCIEWHPATGLGAKLHLIPLVYSFLTLIYTVRLLRSPDRDRDMHVNSNFLGEVLLNVGKLEPFAVGFSLPA
jgi:hypothetical protein